jgi:hypothetical protein
LNDTSQRGLAWQITEAYQPTLPQCGAGQTSGCHQNACHWAATCVDANFTGGIQPTAANVREFVSAANRAGLNAIYETRTQADRDRLVQGGVPAANVQVVPQINAPHFSVYNRVS